MPRESDTLQVGASAPAFTLPTQRGVVCSLSDYLTRGPVLLVFHRGTW